MPTTNPNQPLTHPSRTRLVSLLLALLLSLAGTPATPRVQAADPPPPPAAVAAANNLPSNGLIPLPHLPIEATLTWSGAAGDGLWSNPANWSAGRSPGPTDQVRFPAAASDARIDPDFGGLIAGLQVEAGYSGRLWLGRDLTISGVLTLADGTLVQGGYALHTIALNQPGGEIVGGSAPLLVEEAASVGGTLTTPRDLMSARSLDIAAGGVVRLGAEGKLNLTGEGTPLTGSGLLDIMTHRPNSVEFTGKTVSDITLAGPAGQLRAAGLDKLDLEAGLQRAGASPSPVPWLKPPLKPLAAFARSDSLSLTTEEGNLSSAVLDPANGFAYFGMATFPGQVVKVNIAPASFARVGVVTLNAGENRLDSAVLDPASGFAYFGTFTSPGQVVKVNIAPASFARVGAITLNAGEDNLTSAVIDPANGFAYFGTNTNPGRVVKINIAPVGFARVAALTLNAGENALRSAVIDPANSFAYFGTDTFTTPGPGLVVKINIAPAGFARVGAITLNAGEDELFSAVIDLVNGFAYFGTSTEPGQVIKVNIAPAGFARVGAITLNAGEDDLGAAVLDPVNGLAYFGTDTAPGRVVKVNIAPAGFSRVGAITLNAGENSLRAAVLDPATGFAYFGTNTTTGRVVKVNTTPAGFARVGAIILNAGENSLTSAVIDPANGFAYFGTLTSPGLVVKVNIAPVGFARVGVVTLNAGEGGLASAVIDPANGLAYFGTDTAPGQVVKVNLAPAGFARVGAITLNAGEDFLRSAVLDPVNGFAYFGTTTSPGRVVKVNIAPAGFARVGAIILNAGESIPRSAVIDPANGLAYFGMFTSPGRVVKVNIAPAGFARVGAITLNPAEGNLASAVIDRASGLAYFGTETSPGRVVKVNIAPTGFIRVGAITLNAGEDHLTSAVIDLANGFAYFGTTFNEDFAPFQGQVVKINITPPNFARVGAITLNTGEDFLLSAVLDPVNGFAYFGTFTSPGRVVKIDVSPGQPEMAVLGNGQVISDGDTSPSLSDQTDFGSLSLGGVITRTFTISNSGTEDLNLTGTPRVSLTGAGAGDFSLVSQPTTPVIPNTITSFQVRFVPALVGTRVATLTIANNDSDENPYTFRIQGTGSNTAPVANAGTDQGVSGGTGVTLDGSGSSDPDGHTPLTYGWSQTGGPAVSLSSLNAVSPTFTAPGSPTSLTFTLTVTDSFALADPTPDEVVVTVNQVALYLPIIFKGG